MLWSLIMAARAPGWALGLQGFTERFLTWRKRRRARKKAKQKKKNVILDWLEAFLWAAGVVLLINQYLLQAYRIPSGSMMDTLLLGDRIFVNKLVYGPELLPGLLKLPGFRSPRRGEVIIFENPSYISRGTAFDIVQRVLYMVTLSIVDIDRDENGEPRAHFLIKRAAGVGGDRFRSRLGENEVLLPGEPDWIAERELAAGLGMEHEIRRIIPEEAYGSYPAAARAAAMEDLDLPVSSDDRVALQSVQSVGVVDPFDFDRLRMAELVRAAPHDARIQARYEFYEAGWYVPEDRILPLGDNRDNSRDGRYFGPVHTNDVLGRAMFKYWPITRFGLIR
jgi:signal peptidase I